MSQGPSSASGTSGLGNVVGVGIGVFVGVEVAVGNAVAVNVAVMVGVAVQSSGNDCVTAGVSVGGGGGSLLHAEPAKTKKIRKIAKRFMQRSFVHYPRTYK